MTREGFVRANSYRWDKSYGVKGGLDKMQLQLLRSALLKELM